MRAVTFWPGRKRPGFCCADSAKRAAKSAFSSADGWAKTDSASSRFGILVPDSEPWFSSEAEPAVAAGPALAGVSRGAPSAGLRTTMGIFRSSFLRGGRERFSCAGRGGPLGAFACSRISSNVGCALFLSGGFFAAGGGADFGSLTPCMISSNDGARLRETPSGFSWFSGLSLMKSGFSAPTRAARHTKIGYRLPARKL